MNLTIYLCRSIMGMVVQTTLIGFDPKALKDAQASAAKKI